MIINRSTHILNRSDWRIITWHDASGTQYAGIDSDLGWTDEGLDADFGELRTFASQEMGSNVGHPGGVRVRVAAFGDVDAQGLTHSIIFKWFVQDAEEAADDYVEMCPACGEPSDYCQGHGEIGDPDGYAILTAHDADDHSKCVASACSND